MNNNDTFATFSEILASTDANDGVWIKVESEGFTTEETVVSIYFHAVTCEVAHLVYNKLTTQTTTSILHGEALDIFNMRNGHLAPSLNLGAA